MSDNAGTEARITPLYMFLLVVTIPLFAWLYFILGTRFFDSPLSLEEYVVFSTLIAIIVTGCYQLFFWVQRNNYYFKTRCFVSSLDQHIPFWPSWVWIYSFLYYIAIGFVVASIQSMHRYSFSFLSRPRYRRNTGSTRRQTFRPATSSSYRARTMDEIACRACIARSRCMSASCCTRPSAMRAGCLSA